MAIKTFLNNDEVRKMIDTAEHLRDKVILAFFIDTGCRASELLGVTVENIDLDRREVLIRHLKRGVKKKCPGCGRTAGRSTKFCTACGTDITKVAPEGELERKRLIGIGEETTKLLREYIEGLEPSDFIMNITRQQIYNVVREAGARIGLKGKCIMNPETGRTHNVHPHNLRDSLAVHWLQVAGSDVNKQKALQDQLGHVSFATTMRYDKLSPAMVRKVADEVRKARFQK